MQQLTGMDMTFLHMEAGGAFGHVSSLCIYDGEGAGYEATKQNIERRLHLLPPFRRRLAEVPFGLDNPYWIEDPDFDIEFHVRHTAVPPPGTDDQLAELVARLIARPLDRRHPLWELYVIEGLPEGRIAQLTKVHHAAVDGALGVHLLGIMLDTSRAGTEVPEPTEEWKPDAEPTALEMLGRTALQLAAQPQKQARLAIRTTRLLAEATRNPLLRAVVSRPVLERLPRLPGSGPRRVEDPLPPLPATSAPRTSFNKTITPHRKVAFRTLSLDDVKTVKSAFGATVNDVVMALCAGGLRTYLADRGELPDEPLVAFIPVSLRTGMEGDDIWRNRVSGLTATLATDLADPVERLRTIHDGMAAAKELHGAVPAEQLAELSTSAPPMLMARAARLTARLKIADRSNPPFNVTISNVPGPRVPMYNCGAELQHFFPVSTIGDGAGMNITVQSYRDGLDFGIVTCRELVPQPSLVCDGLEAALAELLEAAGRP